MDRLGVSALTFTCEMLFLIDALVEPLAYVNFTNEVVPGKRSRVHSASCPLQVHDGFPHLSLLTLYQHPAMIRGVKTLKAAANPQTTFLCLSSANTVFISTILEVRAVGRIPSHHHLI
jgi:hypothetical protein